MKIKTENDMATYSVVQYDRLDCRRRRITQICSVGTVGTYGTFAAALGAARAHKQRWPMCGRTILVNDCNYRKGN